MEAWPLKRIHQWLAEYGESHTHPLNVKIHKICVPAIMFSILGMLWLIPIGSSGLNAALVFFLPEPAFLCKAVIEALCGHVIRRSRHAGLYMVASKPRASSSQYKLVCFCGKLDFSVYWP